MVTLATAARSTLVATVTSLLQLAWLPLPLFPAAAAPVAPSVAASAPGFRHCHCRNRHHNHRCDLLPLLLLLLPPLPAAPAPTALSAAALDVDTPAPTAGSRRCCPADALIATVAVAATAAFCCHYRCRSPHCYSRRYHTRHGRHYSRRHSRCRRHCFYNPLPLPPPPAHSAAASASSFAGIPAAPSAAAPHVAACHRSCRRSSCRPPQHPALALCVADAVAVAPSSGTVGALTWVAGVVRVWAAHGRPPVARDGRVTRGCASSVFWRCSIARDVGHTCQILGDQADRASSKRVLSPKERRFLSPTSSVGLWSDEGRICVSVSGSVQ